MDHDEDFARTLRERLDRVQPPIAVTTARVVPRARRRRAVERGVATLALVVVVGGVGVVAEARPWLGSPEAPPAGAPSGAPATSEPDPTEPEPTEPEPVEPAPGEDVAALDRGTWWYTSTVSADGERTETYVSRHDPGLVVSDGDLATATGIGPRSVVGRFMLDGGWVDMLDDPARLPTDPADLAAVLRASVEPDRRSGTDDDKVLGMARDLLVDGGVLPEGLRHAAWAVAADLPGSTVTTGTDALGRTGEVLERASAGEPLRLVRDPATGMLLEESSGSWTSTVSEQRRVEALPVEPTLESSGCTAWESC